MKKVLKPLLGVCLSWLLVAQAETLEGGDGVYVRSGRTFDSYVFREDQSGGHFVNGSIPTDGRPHARFNVGKAPRTQFDLFSLQEEQALWELEQSEIRKRFALAHPPRYSHAKHPNLHWPKVVVRLKSTCVPRKGFSESEDWQEHLTCWNTETKNVE